MNRCSPQATAFLLVSATRNTTQFVESNAMKAMKYQAVLRGSASWMLDMTSWFGVDNHSSAKV